MRKFLVTVWNEYKAYHSHLRPFLKNTGMVGCVGFPLFYLLRFTKSAPPYDDLWLRVIAVVLCLGLWLRDRWPVQLRPYYLGYSYVTMMYILPFFFVFTSLQNGGGVVAVANTFMAAFFVVLLTDWRNTVIMLTSSILIAVLAYVLTAPLPVLPVDYTGRLPILILVVVGGSLFKRTETQIRLERVEAVTALAGSIAHEMRNPLGQIKHSLESMQDALPVPTTAQDDQTLAAAQVNDLYRFVAQGEMAVKRGLQVISMTLDEVSAKPIDTSTLRTLSAADATDKAVQEYGYENSLDQARVRLTVVEDFNFRGEETAYLFVLFNLIKNALYYLALYPQAQLNIIVDRNQVRVRDNGPGIAPELRERLFEPFRSTGKSGGTGLGLAYCRRVMRAFGGEITCDSELGHYTQFTLSFPPIGEDEAQAYRDTVMEQARAVFRGKRLLVVDDEAELRTATRHKLQALDATIDEAADGARALEMLAHQHYDLVVLDLKMPGLDGYAVAEKVRQGLAPASRDACIVAYTGEPAQLSSVKALKAGMDGLVSKPSAQLPLILALQEAMEHPAARARLEAVWLAGLRVVLADDNPYNRKAVAAYLKHAGVDVVEIGNGQAVLDHLNAQGGCGAILLDINMPGMSGLETAQAIRNSDAPWHGVPIIAVTAHSDQATIKAARAAGMNDFLTKPVEAAVLYAKLRQFTRQDRPPQPRPALVSTVDAGAGNALLNLARLESYRRIGMLDEILEGYPAQIEQLAGQLEQAAARHDLAQTQETLHSLVGLSGEAGALALYQLVRRAYVPMVEEQSWPQGDDWAGQIRSMAQRSVQALQAYRRGFPPVLPQEAK